MKDKIERLEKRLGVEKIIISHINNDYYKDEITIRINVDLVLHLVGKTIYFIPLTENGINKGIKSPGKLIECIKNEFRGEVK